MENKMIPDDDLSQNKERTNTRTSSDMGEHKKLWDD